LTAAAVLFTPGCTGPTTGGPESAATGPSVATAPSGQTAAASPVDTEPPSPAPAPTTVASSATASSTTASVTVRTVQLDHGVADEASGIAVATSTPDRFFLVDDGTGASTLAVVDEQGALVARVDLAGMAAANAEALAAGPCGPVPGPAATTCLYVGDIGDNREQRDDIVVYRAAEPDLSDTGPQVSVDADEWHYRYPDGPHNAESMLVEPDGSLLVITKPKNGAPHRMYRGDPGGGELAFVREFQIPGSPRPMRTILTGNVATDLAVTPGRVLLLTYDDVHEYTAPDPSADLTTFPDWPVRSLPLPHLPQAEGIAGAADGCGYVVASEAGPVGTAGSLGIATCG